MNKINKIILTISLIALTGLLNAEENKTLTKKSWISEKLNSGKNCIKAGYNKAIKTSRKTLVCSATAITTLATVAYFKFKKQVPNNNNKLFEKKDSDLENKKSEILKPLDPRKNESDKIIYKNDLDKKHEAKTSTKTKKKNKKLSQNKILKRIKENNNPNKKKN